MYNGTKVNNQNFYECYIPGKGIKIALGDSPKTTISAQNLKRLMRKSQSGSSSPFYNLAVEMLSGVWGFNCFDSDF